MWAVRYWKIQCINLVRDERRSELEEKVMWCLDLFWKRVFFIHLRWKKWNSRICFWLMAFCRGKSRWFSEIFLHSINMGNNANGCYIYLFAAAFSVTNCFWKPWLCFWSDAKGSNFVFSGGNVLLVLKCMETSIVFSQSVISLMNISHRILIFPPIDL